MSAIDDLLVKINAEQREFDQTIWPPASPDAIARLRAVARGTLKIDLPEDYVAFLGRHDGFDFNGHVIYGASEHKAAPGEFDRIFAGPIMERPSIAAGAGATHDRPLYRAAFWASFATACGVSIVAATLVARSCPLR